MNMDDFLAFYKKEGARLCNVFTQVEIAEEEIKKAQLQYPDKEDVIWDSFPILRSPILDSIPSADVSNTLFRTHCRQLLRYVAEGVDLDRPTLVEAAIIVCKLSESAPVQFELAAMVQSDKETMDAFGLENYAISVEMGDVYWPELTRACVRIYKDHRGESRSKLLESERRKVKRWNS